MENVRPGVSLWKPVARIIIIIIVVTLITIDVWVGGGCMRLQNYTKVHLHYVCVHN